MQTLIFVGAACLLAGVATLTIDASVTETPKNYENTEPATDYTESNPSMTLNTSYNLDTAPHSTNNGTSAHDVTKPKALAAYVKSTNNNKERSNLQDSTAHPNDVVHPSESTRLDTANSSLDNKELKNPSDSKARSNDVTKHNARLLDSRAETLSEVREQNETLAWGHPREPKGRPMTFERHEGGSEREALRMDVSKHSYDFEEPHSQPETVAPAVNPCFRECMEGAPPMTCRFRFKLEWYYSMSKACYNCPHNVTDCDRPDCITADGFKRPLIVVNRQMPGPSVEVCHGDRIIVDLVNHMTEESTTIHWHGQHQRGTPYMDGVPYVTQCPIPPRTTFRYSYQADTPGTHFWHSHSGSQRADGVYGSLVVRVPSTRDPNRSLYDKDLPAHTMQLIDWDHQLGVIKFLAHHHADGNNKPLTLIINGRGRYTEFTPAPGGNQEGPLFVPTAKFEVDKGVRYRFRLINAGFLNCPIQLSVDNHNLTIIASDGNDLEPVEAESLITYAGERFDFIINANQAVSNYWVRMRGLMDCDQRFNSAHQVAVLHYNGAPNKNPDEVVSYEANRRKGILVNPVNARMDANDSYVIPELTAAVNDNVTLKPQADLTFYVSYDFYAIDNPTFHKPSVYGFQQVVNKSQRLYTPQLNHITMRLPTSPPLSQPEDLDPDSVCDASSVGDCTTKFCECTHILRVPLGAVVELVLIDIGVTFDANHPFHLHGTAFRVVAMDRLGSNTTVEEVKALDRAGYIKRKLTKAPVKDTVTVPDGGYTIVRFHATNPGFWLLHCHIEFHVEMGMGLLFQVGDSTNFPPVPHHFPRCGNYVPLKKIQK